MGAKTGNREGKPTEKSTSKLRARAWEEWLRHSDHTMQHGQDAETSVEPASSAGEQRFTYGLALT